MRPTRPSNCSSLTTPSDTRSWHSPISYPSPSSLTHTFRYSSRVFSLISMSFVTRNSVPTMSDAEYPVPHTTHTPSPARHRLSIPLRASRIFFSRQLVTICRAVRGGGWSHTFITFSAFTTPKPDTVACRLFTPTRMSPSAQNSNASRPSFVYSTFSASQMYSNRSKISLSFSRLYRRIAQRLYSLVH